jgi:hypothetical protein
MRLGSDLKAGEGEKMDFVRECLKVAASLGTFVTAQSVSNDWPLRKGRVEISSKERARLHGNFRERLNKLAERGLAIRKEAVTFYRGQAAAGWFWNKDAPDDEGCAWDY